MKDREPSTFYGAMSVLERAAKVLFNEMRVALSSAPIVRHVLASKRPGAWTVFAGCVYVAVVGVALQLTTGGSEPGAILVFVGVVGGGIGWAEAREWW